MPAPEEAQDDGDDSKDDDDANDDTDYEAGVIDSITVPAREFRKHYGNDGRDEAIRNTGLISRLIPRGGHSAKNTDASGSPKVTEGRRLV